MLLICSRLGVVDLKQTMEVASGSTALRQSWWFGAIPLWSGCRIRNVTPDHSLSFALTSCFVQQSLLFSISKNFVFCSKRSLQLCTHPRLLSGCTGEWGVYQTISFLVKVTQFGHSESCVKPSSAAHQLCAVNSSDLWPTYCLTGV